MQASEIITIKDIQVNKNNLIGKSIRTWGRIVHINPEASRVKISNDCIEITCRTELVPSFNASVNDSCQFIGDVEEDGLLIKSVQVIDASSFDFKLLQAVLKKRIEFLSTNNNL